MSETGFTADVFQNEYLPEGGREVNAIVTELSPDTGAGGGGSPSTPFAPRS